jgi:homopolymeric O-antigen transport system ATP-binding protein
LKAITAERVAKLYRLGNTQDTLARTLSDVVLRTVRRGGIDKRSQDLWALDDVSFGVDEGEVVGIIGRNGAGKSTVLKLLSRLTEPTRGRITVQGKIGSLLEIGTGFHPELTGRENIFLNGTILGMSRAEVLRRLDEIVEFAEIDRFLDTPVKRYSSGMYVRLAFAVAAHLESDILIVDEVLAVGDLAFQRKCLGRMDQVAHEGKTVLFVSHNLAAIKSLCTRALLLQGGKLVADGAVEETVMKYMDLTWPLTSDGSVPESLARMGTGDAFLRRVRITNEAGDQVERVHLGQPFRVSCRFEVRKRLQDVVIEVGISTPDGMRIATALSSDDGGRLIELEPGMREITVELNMTLLPHPQYVFDIAMHLQSGLTIDWVERAAQFAALNVAERGSDNYPWQTVRGYVRPAARWFAPQHVKQ